MHKAQECMFILMPKLNYILGTLLTASLTLSQSFRKQNCSDAFPVLIYPERNVNLAFQECNDFFLYLNKHAPSLLTL